MFKAGVKINGIAPECALAIMVCKGIIEGYGGEIVVTSVTDGKHSRGSLHYIGHAFDLRTRDFIIKDLERIRQSIADALTDEFDVVLETDHFHIEFQPKS